MKMKRGEFIALSACTMMLTALGIDIMLPAFAEIREYFGLSHDATDTSKIISYFFMGQVAQIVFGAISDRFGRLPILRVGFPIYIVCGIVAGVRDRFVGNEMARIMSLVFTIFLCTPVIAPFLGVAILSVASWQALFLTPPAFAVIVFVWSLRLEESLPHERRVPLDWMNIGRSVRTVMTNRTFLRYTAITTILFTTLSSYVSSSEHIVSEIYGRPKLFAWMFAGVGLTCSLFTLLNSRFTHRYGARRIIRWLVSIYTTTGGLLLLLTLTVGDPPGIVPFFIAVALLIGINLAVEPNSSALALEPLGNAAGMASSIYGTSFFFIGASLGAVISDLMRDGVLPLVVSFFLLGLITVWLVFTDKRPLDAKRSNA